MLAVDDDDDGVIVRRLNWTVAVCPSVCLSVCDRESS